MIEDATKPNVETVHSAYLDVKFDQSQEVCVEPSCDAITLDLKEAAFVLGKSMRALERSLSGKWGNKLPDGWSSRQAIVDGTPQWQIIPPAGFNLDALIEHKRDTKNITQSSPAAQKWLTRGSVWTRGARELALGRPVEIVQLLRELSNTHKELAQERRAHLEDLRMLAELQSSMRLLEVNAKETMTLKTDLIEAQKDLISLKNQYQALLNLPWWKRLFKHSP